MVHPRVLVFGGVMAVFGTAVFELGPNHMDDAPAVAVSCATVRVARCPAAAITHITPDFERHEVVPAAQAHELSDGDESFTIRVVDETGRPVAGATVSFWTGYCGHSALETDAGGSCAVEERPFTVKAAHPRHGVSVEIDVGEALASGSRHRPSRWWVDETECTLVLNRTVTLRGAVFDEDGKLLSGARVFVKFTPELRRLDTASRFIACTDTDEQGRFEVESLPDAEYDVFARTSSWAESIHRFVGVTRHPVTGIVLEMIGRCRITLLGHEPSGAAVRLAWADTLDETPTRKLLCPSGSMGLAVERAGEYLVGVTSWDPKWWAAPRRLVIDEFVREATIDFLPATRLSGLVLDPAGQPLAVARIRVDWWLPDAERQPGGSDSLVTSSDERGEFECFIPPCATAAVLARVTGWDDTDAEFELRARGFSNGLGPLVILRMERVDVGERPAWREDSPDSARLALLLDRELAAAAPRCRFDLRTLNSHCDYCGEFDVATNTVNFDSCQPELTELIVTPECGRLSDFDPRLFQPRIFDLRSGGEHRLALALR